jgi:hypothetical protein
MALMLSEAAIMSCSAVWPVLTMASLSAFLAPISALMVLVEVSSELILSLDHNDKKLSVQCCSIFSLDSGMFFFCVIEVTRIWCESFFLVLCKTIINASAQNTPIVVSRDFVLNLAPIVLRNFSDVAVAIQDLGNQLINFGILRCNSSLSL